MENLPPEQKSQMRNRVQEMEQMMNRLEDHIKTLETAMGVEIKAEAGSDFLKEVSERAESRGRCPFLIFLSSLHEAAISPRFSAHRKCFDMLFIY